MDNNTNNNSVPHSLENTIAVLVVVLAFYYKYRMLIEQYWLDFQERLHNPFFIVFLVSVLFALGLLYYSIGHHLEKFFNQINMWHLGIKRDPNEKPMSFAYILFDFQKQIDDFINAPENKDRTFIGLNAEKQNKEVVSFSDIQRCHHLQILGMTGTGKTAGVFLPLIYQDALKNRPVIIIDAKGESATINRLNNLLDSIGRGKDFLLFSLVDKEKSCTYNPLYVGECDPQIISDGFFSNFKDENTFYRETAKTIFEHAFYILHSLGKPFSIMDVYTYLNDDVCYQDINRQIDKNNEQASRHLKELEILLEGLTEPNRGWRYVIAGFNNYLSSYREDILNDPHSDIVLTDAIRQKKIIYFQLPINAYPTQAVNIARMVQANLRYISSLIQIGKLPKDTLVSVIIDEYGSFAEETFVGVLNKARDSGMMVTIAHQSLSDLSAISDSFMKLIDENTMNKIYLKQTDPVLCELIAKSMGTYIKEEKTYRMTGGKFGNQIHSGESSNRVVNEFYFPPDKIKSLHKFGQGYFIYRGDNSQVCVNLGCFNNIHELPYQKTAKKDKKDGLNLYKRAYQATEPPKPIDNKLKRKKKPNKINDELDYQGK
ncbi:MAG: TraM recognition domain-containing protein [Candidatus Omnitrophica bacterium]|nr:TraM recognition domain-containing protein [Candidatus Omnitrophota bacterium]